MESESGKACHRSKERVTYQKFRIFSYQLARVWVSNVSLQTNQLETNDSKDNANIFSILREVGRLKYWVVMGVHVSRITRWASNDPHQRSLESTELFTETTK